MAELGSLPKGTEPSAIFETTEKLMRDAVTVRDRLVELRDRLNPVLSCPSAQEDSRAQDGTCILHSDLMAISFTVNEASAIVVDLLNRLQL